MLNTLELSKAKDEPTPGVLGHTTLLGTAHEVKPSAASRLETPPMEVDPSAAR